MRYLRAARLEQIPEGGALGVSVGGVQVVLVRVEGRVYAVADACTHESARLSDGFVEGHAIECPRHGAMFDVRTGEARCLPATAAVRTFAVKVVGDDVLLGLEDATREEENHVGTPASH